MLYGEIAMRFHFSERRMRKLLTSVAFLTLVLSGGQAAFAASAPESYVASLRRLTEQEYRNSIADIFGKEIEVRGVFEPTIRTGGLEAASTATLSVTPAGFESFTKMADTIAAQVTADKYRAKLPCAPKDAKAPDDACTGQVLSQYGQLLFRRPITADELQSRVAVSRVLAKQTNDFYAGLRYGLATLLQSPDFVFRKETAVLAPDGKGYTLDSYSRATRLSFLLWDSAPDAELIKAAANGELNNPTGLVKQVDRLMASSRLETGMRAFFDDMLQLDTFDVTSKDSVLYPKWGSAMGTSAREETLRTVIGLSLQDNGDIRDLMTTRQTYIDRRLAVLYKIPFPFTGEWVKYEFPADAGRSGLLTQISMLTMFSHPGRSSPTERGVAIQDIFLCSPTPPPPANVDFSIINNTDGPLKTVRERLMAHATNKTCASCHTHSDPIGLPLENFDTIGGYRTAENGVPIDVSANIQGQAFTGAEGLGKYMHDNPRYPACVARKLYAYARGLDSIGVKTDDFKDAYKSFVDSNYRLRKLLNGMAVSDTFYAAAPPPAPVAPTKVAAKDPIKEAKN
jgi:hypothetical protein